MCPFLPIGSAALTRAGRNTGQQPPTAELLLDVGVKCAALLALFKLPQDMVALLGFLRGTFSLLSNMNSQNDICLTL